MSNKTDIQSLCDFVPVHRKCNFEASAKLILTLCLIALSWTIIPLRYSAVSAQWFDNEIIPKSGYWVIAIALLGLWKRWPLLRQKHQKKYPAWLFLGVILILWTWTSSLSAHAMHYIILIAAAAIVFGIGGWLWLRLVFPSLIILCFLSGLPPSFHAELLLLLQNLVARVGHAFCKFFLSAGYVRDGLMIYRPVFWGNSLPRITSVSQVAPECSGIRSLFGLSLISVLFAAELFVPILRKLVIFIVAILLALLANFTRAIVTLSLLHHNQKELASGLAHAALGQGIMLLEVVCLFVIVRLNQIRNQPFQWESEQ